LLTKAMERAGIDRAACYLTNAVKHFKFEPRGKRRLHKSPNRQEIDHCRWWLDQERARIRPKVIVALGVSAVRAVTGKQSTLSEIRSKPLRLDGDTQMLATVHPAFLLRLTDEQQKREEWKRFLDDLRLAHDLAA
ncbi:MAG: uracil-DNA glycosylase, partial [Proteobacteria bacterium]|nr:uracil-DNA glycosylase [Pseudomonadota bacterium]